MKPLITSLDKHFESLRDPRRAQRRIYPLKTILILAVLATVCGCNDWVAYGTCKSVLRQNKQLEGTLRISRQHTSSKSGVLETTAGNQAKGKVVQDGEDVSGVAATQIAVIFMEGDIAALMRATLNAPVASENLKEHFGRSLIGPQAGDTVGDGLSGFASFLLTVTQVCLKTCSR